jgi:hypothetical protein
MSNEITTTHPTSELLAYWLDELDEAAADAVEEHLFGCAACTAQLRELIQLGGAVRSEFVSGNLGMVVTAPFVRRMQAGGIRTREYTLQPGGSVNCTIAPQDDFVISRLQAPLGDVRQLDLVYDVLDGAPRRATHIPFDAATGEVTVIPPAAALRTLGHATQRMVLVAVENGTDRTIAEYTFNHSPY